MKKYKIQDSAGRRFVVYATNRNEARKKAVAKTTAKNIYII